MNLKIIGFIAFAVITSCSDNKVISTCCVDSSSSSSAIMSSSNNVGKIIVGNDTAVEGSMLYFSAISGYSVEIHIVSDSVVGVIYQKQIFGSYPVEPGTDTLYFSPHNNAACLTTNSLDAYFTYCLTFTYDSFPCRVECAEASHYLDTNWQFKTYEASCNIVVK